MLSEGIYISGKTYTKWEAFLITSDPQAVSLSSHMTDWQNQEKKIKQPVQSQES